MTSTRETILQALLAALQTVPGATVLREDILPERIPAAGLVILRDGDPGTPEVTLSPLAYHYEHRAELEVIVQGKTPAARAAAFDLLVQAIGAALAADRTLGGFCDWTEAQAPQPIDLPVEDAAALKAAIITELGCPAVDRGTNQPNVFYDPKSAESALPHFSRGWQDEAIQRRYIEAMLGYWGDAVNNPVSAVCAASMVDIGEAAIWTWDARPYPDFPAREDIWADAPNWRLGHWLNGLNRPLFTGG